MKKIGVFLIELIAIFTVMATMFTCILMKSDPTKFIYFNF